MCAKPASPLGEKHIFENQSVKLGNPAPLSVPKSNGKPSGVHTNLALTATVKW